MSPGYGEDLAAIHDEGFGDPARRASGVLIERLRDRGLAEGLVVDLGCGGGILSEAVSAAGYEVYGIDLSPSMIDRARRRVPEARFAIESIWECEIPSAVGIAAVGEIINYRFDDSQVARGVRSLFERIHSALGVGGVFVFDFAAPGRIAPGSSVRKFAEGEDWAIMFEATADEAGDWLTRTMTTFRRIGGEHFRRDREVHRLELFRPDEIADLLSETGFRAEALGGYGDEAFPPGWCGFVAERV
jgi:SAM-dependent methyltransferase